MPQQRLLTGAGKQPRLYRGLPVPSWFHESTSEALQRMELRPSDIVLCSWPKSGTHWVYRALRLLTMEDGDDTSLSTQRLPEEPPMMLAEALPSDENEKPPPLVMYPNDSFSQYLEREEEVSSSSSNARIIVSHSISEWLPPFDGDEREGGERGGGKLVYVVRDPRDVVTSNHFFLGTPADGWAGSMKRFCASAEETPNAFGPWPEHVLAFESLAARLGPQRACIVEYEDMHRDLSRTLEKIAQLIGPEAEARLANRGDAIKKALSFDEMKKDSSRKGGHAMFLRKGVSGGWREHFSENDERILMKMVSERMPVVTEDGTSVVAGVGRWRGCGGGTPGG